MLDGTQKKVSTWDNVNREWKVTALGKTFYSKAVDKFTMLWPVKIPVENSIQSQRSVELPLVKLGELGLARNAEDAWGDDPRPFRSSVPRAT